MRMNFLARRKYFVYLQNHFYNLSTIKIARPIYEYFIYALYVCRILTNCLDISDTDAVPQNRFSRAKLVLSARRRKKNYCTKEKLSLLLKCIDVNEVLAILYSNWLQKGLCSYTRIRISDKPILLRCNYYILNELCKKVYAPFAPFLATIA